MRRSMILLVVLLLAPSVLGQYMMYGGDGGMYYSGWYWLWGVVMFALGCFVFSFIFWATYRWIVPASMKKR